MSSLPYNFGYSITESYMGRYCEPLYVELFGVAEMTDQGMVGLAWDALESPFGMVSELENGWTTQVRAHRNLPVLNRCKGL